MVKDYARQFAGSGYIVEHIEFTGNGLMEVHHNTLIIRNNFRPRRDNPDHISAGYLEFGFDLKDGLSASITNNIFANYGLPLQLPIYDAEDGFTHPDLEMHHNLYHDINGLLSEPPDGGEGSLLADPLLVDFKLDASLSEGSPAIDAGIDLGEAFERPGKGEKVPALIGAPAGHPDCTPSSPSGSAPRR